MAPVRKILIADPDLDAVRPLSRALRRKGYQVHYAPDGSRALEVAVLRHPDLTLFDEACRLLEAKTFIQILRTNPRTGDIPVVMTGQHLEPDKLRGLRDGFLRKPFNLDEVLSRIDHLLRRNEAARELQGESQEIEGALGQLGIADLLQILGMNKRSGRLSLTRNAERGEIFVGAGRPINARLGRVEGEKALFRLLTWAEGTFAFVPGPPAVKERIQRGMDDALLEGMRQADEVARFVPTLPPRHARLMLSPSLDLPRDQHPVTSQVVELLRQPRLLSELLDLAPSTDSEVLAVLATLMHKGVARVAPSEGDDVTQTLLLAPGELHALRTRLLRGKSATRVTVAKILVCGQAPSAPKRLLARLPQLVTVAAEPIALTSGFGTLGRLDINEVLRVDFCVLPSQEAARPLWRPFCAGAVGALLLDEEESTLALAAFLAWDAHVPLVRVGAQVPPSLVGAPAGVASSGDDFNEALRSVLLQALHPGPALPGSAPRSRLPA